MWYNPIKSKEIKLSRECRSWFLHSINSQNWLLSVKRNEAFNILSFPLYSHCWAAPARQTSVKTLIYSHPQGSGWHIQVFEYQKSRRGKTVCVENGPSSRYTGRSNSRKPQGDGWKALVYCGPKRQDIAQTNGKMHLV